MPTEVSDPDAQHAYVQVSDAAPANPSCYSPHGLAAASPPCISAATRSTSPHTRIRLPPAILTSAKVKYVNPLAAAPRAAMAADKARSFANAMKARIRAAEAPAEEPAGHRYSPPPYNGNDDIPF
jgi:hypothetical protein